MRMTRSVAAAGCVLALLAGIVFADAKSDYEMLFGDEAKKVLASKSTADDAAFAKRLLDAAKALTDTPKTQVFIYEKVVQFGGKDAAGAPHALEAIGILIKAQPEQQAKWQEAKLNVAEKQYQMSRGANRKEVAKAYLDVLIETAEAKAAAGNAKEAVEVYRKGVPVAIYAAYKLSEIRDSMRDLVGALAGEAEREKLMKKLAADPKDTKTREKLILIYVMELDDPAKAASLLATGMDQKLRQCVPLAAKKPADLTEAACMQLGQWYHKTLLEKAPRAGKAVVLGRAKIYYERYLSLHTKRDMGRYMASAALVEVNKDLKKLGVAPSHKFLTLDLGKGVTMKLVLIPAGSFMMGSPESEKGRRGDEGPQHKVTISKPFYMGITEVTKEQCVAVLGEHTSNSKRAKIPVERVSWNNAVGFCKKLSAKTRRTVRLPTEGEWEYACRAGTKTVFCFGDDEKELGDYAWHSANSGGKAHPVGQKKPNAWGLYDMHGNVREWCQDWYDERYYAKPRAIDPQGPTLGTRRVLRGGGWLAGIHSCRSGSRFPQPPGAAFADWGLRVVVETRAGGR